MKFKPVLSLGAFILLAATCSKHHFEREHLLVESLFESTSPFTDWDNNQHCCDYSLEQSTTRFTDGGHSLRLNVKSTDAMTSGSIRSELVQPVEGMGKERWYGFNMFLENWSDDNAGEHVFQWHPDNSTGAATAALWTSGGRYVYETNNNGTTQGNEYTDFGPIISNQWVAWVIHVKWADDNTGIMQVWKNGTLVMDKSHIKTAPSEGTYFKLGINKFGWGSQPSTSTERILYFDEVRIGDENASYEDVKPNGQ